jgi:HTH-type transcriptional regulator/antitoxin HigA
VEIKPIRTRVDYERTLQEIERLWGSRKGTLQGDRLDVMATLVDANEQKHFPIDPADPIEAIRFRLEQQGLDSRALVRLIDGRSRVYEVMQRKRALSLEMIRRLHQRFGIPAEVLIRPTPRPLPPRRIALQATFTASRENKFPVITAHPPTTD